MDSPDKLRLTGTISGTDLTTEFERRFTKSGAKSKDGFTGSLIESALRADMPPPPTSPEAILAEIRTLADTIKSANQSTMEAISRLPDQTVKGILKIVDAQTHDLAALKAAIPDQARIAILVENLSAAKDVLTQFGELNQSISNLKAALTERHARRASTFTVIGTGVAIILTILLAAQNLATDDVAIGNLRKETTAQISGVKSDVAKAREAIAVQDKATIQIMNEVDKLRGRQPSAPKAKGP